MEVIIVRIKYPNKKSLAFFNSKLSNFNLDRYDLEKIRSNDVKINTTKILKFNGVVNFSVSRLPKNKMNIAQMFIDRKNVIKPIVVVYLSTPHSVTIKFANEQMYFAIFLFIVIQIILALVGIHQIEHRKFLPPNLINQGNVQANYSYQLFLRISKALARV